MTMLCCLISFESAIQALAFDTATFNRIACLVALAWSGTSTRCGCLRTGGRGRYRLGPCLRRLCDTERKFTAAP